MRIKSRVKDKKEIVVKKACVLVSDENQNNFFIFDTDDTNIRFGIDDSVEIVMWFKDTRPFDRYDFSGIKPHDVKIFFKQE